MEFSIQIEIVSDLTKIFSSAAVFLFLLPGVDKDLRPCSTKVTTEMKMFLFFLRTSLQGESQHKRFYCLFYSEKIVLTKLPNRNFSDIFLLTIFSIVAFQLFGGKYGLWQR